MHTTRLVSFIFLSFFPEALMEINVVKISGRNTDLSNGKTIQTPVELDENHKNTHLDVTVPRPTIKSQELLRNLASANPILATLLLSYDLHISPDLPGFNHPEHLPLNPYVALLLSHYGRYVPLSPGHRSDSARGFYGYTAANNYHNNLPFGSYKIYTDRDAR